MRYSAEREGHEPGCSLTHLQMAPSDGSRFPGSVCNFTGIHPRSWSFPRFHPIRGASFHKSSTTPSPASPTRAGLTSAIDELTKLLVARGGVMRRQASRDPGSPVAPFNRSLCQFSLSSICVSRCNRTGQGVSDRGGFVMGPTILITSSAVTNPADGRAVECPANLSVDQPRGSERLRWVSFRATRSDLNQLVLSRRPNCSPPSSSASRWLGTTRSHQPRRADAWSDDLGRRCT